MLTQLSKLSYTIYTLQKHQWILTNATVSKDSNFGFIMVVYDKIFIKYFKVLETSEELCIKTNIA